MKSSLHFVEGKRLLFAPDVQINGVAQVANSGFPYCYKLSMVLLQWDV